MVDNKIICMGLFGCIKNFVFCGWDIVSDILSKACVKQDRLLTDYTELLPQMMDVIIFDVGPI